MWNFQYLNGDFSILATYAYSQYLPTYYLPTMPTHLCLPIMPTHLCLPAISTHLCAMPTCYAYMLCLHAMPTMHYALTTLILAMKVGVWGGGGTAPNKPHNG